MNTARTASPPLLDRTAELDVISAAVGAAASGSGTSLVIAGPAGIGKTSLLRHACRLAETAGMTVLAARAAELEGSYAWAVARQIFAPALRDDSGSLQADSVVELAAAALTKGVYRGDEDAFAILHGLYWLTADIAQRRPLLIAIDDLHWADQASQRFVAHMARRLEGLAVLLVATIREPRSGTAQDKALTAALVAEQGVTVLRPAALSASACARLVADALGTAASAAFIGACRDVTGGNPLLINALLAGLAAEGSTGADAEVPHVRKLTPSTVSRSVLLQLGRMQPAALAAARGIAVLGTAATTARAGRLASLDGDTCAEAVAALMAEHLIEGHPALQFVHPLVRSVVYEDIAPPIRQRWHYRAARMLDADGAPPEHVTTHLLASGAAGDPWVVARLRSAAGDARERGAADVAVLCLQRALAEPPPADIRAVLLAELGTALLVTAPAEACVHLREAQSGTEGAQRAQVTLTLSEALALSGRFAEAVAVLQDGLATTGDDNAQAKDAMQAALLNIARWDLDTRPLTGPLIEKLRSRAQGRERLDPQLHANLAIELAAAGIDRESAVRHARAAVRALPELMSVTAAALPEAVSVLLFADLAAEAEQRSQAWLRLAQQHGWPLASAVAATAAALTSLCCGDISQALAYGQQATSGPGWIPVIDAAFMTRALLDRGDSDSARSLLADQGLAADLDTSWPYNVVRHARGCLHAAVGDHAAASADLLAAGELAERWGIANPAMMPWRSDAALSLRALGAEHEARRLCAEELTRARRWGAHRAIGIAMRAAALVGDPDRRTERLAQAVDTLRDSPGRLELARTLLDLGAACRRIGAVSQARVHLREALHLAHSMGGLGVAAKAREELVVAGGRPRRDAILGRDALTPSELRVAQLAASGQTNRQIAQALFVTRRTVENHLTSSYGKLGIRSRAQLHQALGETHAPTAS